MKWFTVVVEKRNLGAIGAFECVRVQALAQSDENAIRDASDLVRAAGYETGGAWIIMSRERSTEELRAVAAYTEKLVEPKSRGFA